MSKEKKRKEKVQHLYELTQCLGKNPPKEEIIGLDEMGGGNVEDREIRLRCVGDEKFNIILPQGVRKYSRVLDNILDGDDDAKEMVLPREHRPTLPLLEKFLLHHVEFGLGKIELSTTGDLEPAFSDPFDYEFVRNLTCEECCGLTASAEWLYIPSLIEVTTALFLNKFLGCTEAELLKIFETCEWNAQANYAEKLYEQANCQSERKVENKEQEQKTIKKTETEKEKSFENETEDEKIDLKNVKNY